MLWLLILLFASGVEAQTHSNAFSDSTEVKIRYQDFRYRDPGTAFLLSFGSTFVPATVGAMLLKGSSNNSNVRTAAGLMIAYGLLVGPSMGLFYAGNDAKAVLGVLGRTAAAGVVVVGLAWAVSATLFDYDSHEPIGPGVLFFSGAGFLIGSILMQIVQAPLEAQKHNKALHLSLAPTWCPKAKTPGLAVRLRF